MCMCFEGSSLSIFSKLFEVGEVYVKYCYPSKIRPGGLEFKRSTLPTLHLSIKVSKFPQGSTARAYLFNLGRSDA